MVRKTRLLALEYRHFYETEQIRMKQKQLVEIAYFHFCIIIHAAALEKRNIH